MLFVLLCRQLAPELAAQTVKFLASPAASRKQEAIEREVASGSQGEVGQDSAHTSALSKAQTGVWESRKNSDDRDPLSESTSEREPCHELAVVKSREVV